MIAERGKELLSAAAQRGELEAVEALLKAGVSARANAPGELPLMQAFAMSEAAAVKSRPSAIAQWQQTSNMLKSVGPNANPEFTASMRSQEAEQAAKVAAFAPEHLMQIRDLLIKNGADYDAFAATALADTNRVTRLLAADKNMVQARDRDGQTPLHWAVLNDQLRLTSFWLKAGASPVATNFAGQTPLHIAAAKGLTEQVKLLLAANAPTDIRDTNGWTPLDAAIQAKQSDSIHLLMAKAPAAAHPERGLSTSLHEAAASGNVAALAGLLDTEKNLEARDELGLTPLQVAVLHGHLAAAALLVDKGANVNVRDPDGNTVLLQVLPRFFGFYVSDRPSTNWLAARLAQNPHKEEYLKYLTVGQYEQGPRAVLQSASFLLTCGIDASATNLAGQTAIQLATDERIALFDDREPLLKLLGSGGGNVNEMDTEGNTALHRAAVAYADNLGEQVPALIASRADINATNFQGRTPLHVAVEKIGMWPSNPGGPDNAILSLIAAKANVNAQDNEGMTPLHVLALADTSFRIEGIRALLDAGANPNLRDKQGRTPAHLFLSGKWPWDRAGECIDMLVAAGADLSAKDDQGKTPLHDFAALGSEKPMFFIRGIGDTFVLAKVNFNARDNDGNTPSHLAAKTGTWDVYDWLTRQGADLDATNKAGETPRRLAMHSTDPLNRFRFNADTDIFQAIRQNKLESVAAILKSEPDLLNQANQSGQTPLLVAAQARRTNIVDFLDAQGVRWDPVSAILSGHVEVLRKLIAQQPNLAFNGSLLREAADNGNVPAVEILLAAGADLKATDQYGLSPLGIALSQQHGNVADLLTKRGSTKNIFDAVFTDDAKTVEALIGQDKSLASAANDDGLSVAEVAAATGKDQILKLLLDKGVSPNFQNPATGKSLIEAAAECNQTNTAELLIQRRTKLDIEDNDGYSPIHIAALRDSAAVLELLLKHKADPNLRTAASGTHRPPIGSAPPFVNWRMTALQGNSPLHLAALASQTNAIALLLKWGASISATNSYGMTPLSVAIQILQRPPSLINQSDIKLPFVTSSRRIMDPFRQGATIALLERAGGKQGERRGPAGMMPFGPPTMTRFPSMTGAPGPQAPVLHTGADYHVQGCVDYDARRFTNALADFRKSCELGSDNQDYSYFRIWLIRARLGEKDAATQEMAAYLERRKAQKPDGWPSKVGRFLAGQMSESNFLKAADDPNSQTAKEQHCEAYFYVGSIHLIENDKMAAVDYFKKCLTTNVTDFEEYHGAAAELQFLEMPAPN